MTADPTATPVTCTFAVVAPEANVTVAGTVATLVLLELRFMVSPPDGAGAESVRVNVCVVAPVIVRVVGTKLAVAITWTVCVPAVKPGAAAVMFAEPKLTAVTVGCVTGTCAPAGITTLLGEILTMDEALLLSNTVVPPAGAGIGNTTG